MNQITTELNKVKFSVAGEANLARNLEKNAELQVKLNKRDYEPGEPIEVNIRAPYAGAGLINDVLGILVNTFQNIHVLPIGLFDLAQP